MTHAQPSKSAFSAWVLMAIFVAGLLVFSLCRIPAAYVYGDIPQIEGQIDGTVFEAHAEALSIQGYPVQKASLSLVFWPLLLGERAGHFRVNGSNAKGFTQFEAQGHQMKLSNAEFQFTEAVTLMGQAVTTSTTLSSKALILGEAGCIGGQFTVFSDLLERLFTQFGWEGGPRLEGQGLCAADGTMQTKLAGTSRDFTVLVEASVQGAVVTATVELVPAKAPSDMMLAVLHARGFQFDGTAFTGQVTLHVAP